MPCALLTRNATRDSPIHRCTHNVANVPPHRHTRPPCDTVCHAVSSNRSNTVRACRKATRHYTTRSNRPCMARHHSSFGSLTSLAFQLAAERRSRTQPSDKLRCAGTAAAPHRYELNGSAAACAELPFGSKGRPAHGAKLGPSGWSGRRRRRACDLLLGGSGQWGRSGWRSDHGSRRTYRRTAFRLLDGNRHAAPRSSYRNQRAIGAPALPRCWRQPLCCGS